MYQDILRIPTGRRFRDIAPRSRCARAYSEYLPADVLEAVRHTRVHTHMLKIPACRYFQYAQAHLCTLEACPKHLQADVLSTFSYFGVKLFAAYHMPTGIPKRLHADVLLFFCLSVWLLAICPGGRTGAICRQTCLATFFTWPRCTHDSAGLRGHERPLRAAADFFIERVCPADQRAMK